MSQAMANDAEPPERTAAVVTSKGYTRADPLCCPTGGGKIVRFRWNGSRLAAVDAIPSSDANAPLLR